MTRTLWTSLAAMALGASLSACDLHGKPKVERRKTDASAAPAVATTSSAASEPAGGDVVAPGIVEPWGGQVDLSAQEPGWIARILVKEGDVVYALNGGPQFSFTPAISFFVNCETQQEVDALWEKLSAGGSRDQCGWLKDKFGLSWQIVPSILGKLLGDKDPEKANRVMQAMLQMTKIDIKGLQRAYDRG